MNRFRINYVKISRSYRHFFITFGTAVALDICKYQFLVFYCGEIYLYLSDGEVS